MYRDSYQHGMLTVFFSVGSKPLNIWETHIRDGSITRFLDDEIKSMVLEIRGTNVSTTYMTCPKGKAVLGIHMPFMVMIVKNLKKYFSFEVTILDDTGTRRRFRVSNFQSTSQVLPLSTAMPIGLNEGWNQIQFDLGKFTQKAYKRQFVEVQKLKINANIRLRRIYFTRRLIPDDELPAEFKLYFPLVSKGTRGRKIIDKAKESEVLKAGEEGKVESKTVIQKAKSKTSQQSIKRASQEKDVGGASTEQLVAVEEVPIDAEEKLSHEKVRSQAQVSGGDLPVEEAPPAEDIVEVPGEGATEFPAEVVPSGALSENLEGGTPPAESALQDEGVMDEAKNFEAGQEEPVAPESEVQKLAPVEATEEVAEPPGEG